MDEHEHELLLDDRARAGAGVAVMLRRLRLWLRRIKEARQADTSFGGQLTRARRKQSELKRLGKEFGREPSERHGQ